MICPKCGRSVPGTSCPYCDEPQIDDRTDDYLKRRNKYESEINESFQESNTKDYIEDTGSDKQVIKTRKNIKKALIAAVIAAGAVTALIISASSIKPSLKFNGCVCFEADNDYFVIADSEIKNLGSARDVYFTSEKDLLYKSEMPKSLKENNSLRLVQTMASPKGEFFTYCAYDASAAENNYKLYLWDKSGSLCEAFTGNSMLSVKYVSDKGCIVFTGADVITDELGVGNAGLKIFVPKSLNQTLSGENIQIDASSSFDTHICDDKLLIRNSEGDLYVSDLNNPEEKKYISHDTSTVKPLKSSYYRHVSGSYDSRDDSGYGLVCCKDENGWFIYDIINDKRTDSQALSSSFEGFIFDKSLNMFYINDNEKLYMFSERQQNNQAEQFKLIDTELEPDSFIWDHYSDSGIYIKKGKGLMRLKKDEVIPINSDTDIFPIKVQNDTGYIYISDNTCFYAKDFGKEAKRLTGNISSKRLISAARSGDSIYVLTQEKALIEIILKDGSVHEINHSEELFTVGNF